MYDHNQLEIADSFLALFLSQGRLPPGLTRELLTARYELCEDLAVQLRDYAIAQHLDAGLPQRDVLERCHRGLLSGASGVSEAEAGWVVQRLAELADWPVGDPGLDPGGG